MNFAYADNYWILLIVPLVLVLSWYRYREEGRRLRAFADSPLLSRIVGGFELRRGRRLRSAALIGAITLLLAIGSLRPQWGFTWKESKRKGVDIIVAVDVSESMLAEDVSPNRLSRAQHEILDLLEHLRGDRIGLVAFAGTAFLEVPLTIDYGTFRLFLDSLAPELIPIQGTNIESALERSIEAFGIREQAPSEGKSIQRDRAVILITDGEAFQGDIERSAARAKEFGIRIYVFGIGTPEGGPIPTRGGFKKDNRGTIVVTRLEEDALVELAKRTEGVFVRAIASDSDTKAIYDIGIKSVLQDQAFTGTRAKRWNEYYQFPLGLALILLLLNVLRCYLPERRGLSAGVILLFALSWVEMASAASPEKLAHDGRAAYERGEYDKALEQFNHAAIRDPLDSRYKLGQGSSYYRLGKYSDAKSAFLDAVEKSKDAPSKARALYNTGNSLVQLEQLEDAIKSYEQSLELVPDDEEVKENLAYAKRLLEQQKQEEKNENKQNEKKEQQQDEQQQQSEEEKQSEKSEEKQQSEQSKEEEHQEEEQSKASDQEESPKDESKDQKQASSTEENNKENERQKQENQPGKQQQPNQSSDGEASSQEDLAEREQARSILDSLQEDRSAFLKYRNERAEKEMKEKGIPLPVKDW